MRKGGRLPRAEHFSVRGGSHIFITPTGLDKGNLTPPDLLEIDLEGRAIAGRGSPSAETGLHTVIYRARVGAHAILHVHTVWNTLLSVKFLRDGHVPLEGYELLEEGAGGRCNSHAFGESAHHRKLTTVRRTLSTSGAGS